MTEDDHQLMETLQGRMSALERDLFQVRTELGELSNSFVELCDVVTRNGKALGNLAQDVASIPKSR